MRDQGKLDKPGFKAVKSFISHPLAPLLIALKCWGYKASGREAKRGINLRGQSKDWGRGRKWKQAC